jgi:PTS system mannose-specific IIB component
VYDAICVIDDSVAQDTFMRDVLRMAGPADIPVYIFSVKQAASALEHLHSNDVLLLIKTPQSVLQLMDAGIEIDQLNIGNIASAPGRKRVFKSISLGPEHINALDALAKRGVQITFQIVPNDTAADWQSVRKKYYSGK